MAAGAFWACWRAALRAAVALEVDETCDEAGCFFETQVEPLTMELRLAESLTGVGCCCFLDGKEDERGLETSSIVKDLVGVFF